MHAEPPQLSPKMPSKQNLPRIDRRYAHFKLSIRRSPIERWGVFAEEAIPAGKKVIQYTGERITHREATRRAVKLIKSGKPGRIYGVYINSWSCLDGAAGSGAQYINHSCDPNLTVKRAGEQFLLYSFRRIRPGEELTMDYGFKCSCPCQCGSANCRGTMCRVRAQRAR
ncbi:MAG: SET domain-containing protein [Candidatus Acidiferrales bacterium]